MTASTTVFSASEGSTLKNLYLRLTDATSAPFEWAWNLIRVMIALALMPLSFIVMEGTAAALGIAMASLAVITYSAVLARLIRRGKLRVAFLAGFTLDNVVVVIAWWLTVDVFRAPGDQSDLWLSILPITILGIARSGPALGASYVVFMMAVLSWLTLGFEERGTYAYVQLPARVIFVGIVGGLTVWLVAELKRQREAARSLQNEAETLAEISSVAGSSLEISKIFPKLSSLVATLVPFDILVLAMVTDGEDTLDVLGFDGGHADVASLNVSTLTLPAQAIPAGKSLADCLGERGTRRLKTDECARFTQLASADGTLPFQDMSSLIVSPVISGSRVVGSLFACSPRPNAFNSEHVRIVERVTEFVGASIANFQLYRSTRQLAQEKEARYRLDIENRKLQEDNEAKTVFLSAVSHELRTPLTSMIAFTDLVLRNKNGNLDDKQIGQLQLVRRNGQQLARLVDDLLELSRLGSQRIKLVLDRFSASEAIGEIVASVTPMLQVKGQTLVAESESADRNIIADRQRFAQVSANLISNASKYSPDNSSIHLSWRFVEDMFEMEVTDRGSGIPESEQVHLFQPFFRASQHRVDKIPGTGLGLVITKNLLQAHGGGISIQSSHEGADRGTQVRIWFPADGSGLSEYIRSQGIA